MLTTIIALIFTIAVFAFVVHLIMQAPIPTIYKTLIAGIAFFCRGVLGASHVRIDFWFPAVFGYKIG